MKTGNDPKLYVKVACSLCLGGHRKGIFMNCPYCDEDRMTYIEVSFKTLQENLIENLTGKEKKKLIMSLQENK
mgnify:CR=1 FL=1|jgi:hypothetical protein|tara:strand:- start:3636 stop:3854 length:219 start_codon:yes stop_codon:yes gene_type:complete